MAANASLETFSVDLSTTLPSPFRVEAEDLTVDQSFLVKNLGNASNGQVLQAGGDGEQRATYVFAGDDGLWDIGLG